MRVSCFAIDEIAIEGELPDERIDLAQGQGHGRAAFDVLAHEAIGRHADLERGFGGVLDDGRRRVSSRARGRRGCGGRRRRRRAGGCACTRRRCAGRPSSRAPAAPASWPACARAGRRRAIRYQPRRRAQVLAQELAGLRREQADVQIVPLHLDALPDPAGRRAVVRGLDFDAAVEMHRAFAEAVVAKRFERERPERGPLLGKHHGDLALRGAVDARVGPVRFPAIQIRLRRLERLEAQALQRRLLRVADAGFDFPFAIGIADAARQARRRRSGRARRDRAD